MEAFNSTEGSDWCGDCPSTAESHSQVTSEPLSYEHLGRATDLGKSVPVTERWRDADNEFQALKKSSFVVTTGHIDRKKGTTSDILKAQHLAARQVANMHAFDTPLSMGVSQGRPL